jgi:D-alanyl-D-alanine dipeptidase
MQPKPLIHFSSPPLPEGFVYLEDIDPSILQEIRYAGSHNFVGRPIAGYEAPRCITTLKVAEALKPVQDELRPRSLTLKVYDAYRPLRASADFLKWSLDAEDQKMRAEFYPDVDKGRVFELGYIALRSQHCRGCAIDLTLVPLPVSAQATYTPGDQLVDSRLPKGQRFDDNSVEMGTGFDCFDALASTAHPQISKEARENRMLLKGLMEKQGFENYSAEWWHFSLKDEPFPDIYYDFPIR